VSRCTYFLFDQCCKLQKSVENPQWTSFLQEAKVTAFPYGVAGTLESFFANKFRTNAIKGRQIMELAIDRVKTESAQAFGKIADASEHLKTEAGGVLGKAEDYLNLQKRTSVVNATSM
jgi:hypothetical protein